MWRIPGPQFCPALYSMNTFSLDEFYDRFYGGRHSIPVPRSEMRKACIGLLVAAKIGTDASVPHENSANDFALTSNGMLKLERYLLIQRRLAAALVIQRWWRPMFSKRTIMKLSEKYRLSVNEKGPHQEEFLEMLQLPSTFASVGRLEPKVVSNHGDSYNDKMYQMYSAILIKWISAVLQEQPASTDFLANLQSGDIFCRLITEMHKNVQCPLLKNGREYAIHKIVFFLEVCISFRIKRVLHFKIENVFGMSNSYSDGIAVMRTLLAVEKHARMTGWQGPPLPLKSVDDMRLGVRQMDSVWSGSASSQASQNNRPSLAPLNIGRVAKPEQTLHVRNHSLPTIIAVKQSESSATHHSRSGSASALPQTDSPVDPSEISLSSPEESYEGSPREIYPIAEHVVAESEKSLSKVVAPIVENSQQVLDFVADEVILVNVEEAHTRPGMFGRRDPTIPSK